MTTLTSTAPPITAENVLRLFPDVDASLASSHRVPTDDVDLQGYDGEQVRLMEEVCIILDSDDKPIGSASKKVCTSRSSILVVAKEYSAHECTYRPSHEEHQRRASSPRFFRLSLQLPKPVIASAESFGKDHLSRHVDQYLLLSSSRDS